MLLNLLTKASKMCLNIDLLYFPILVLDDIEARNQMLYAATVDVEELLGLLIRLW